MYETSTAAGIFGCVPYMWPLTVMKMIMMACNDSENDNDGL